MVSNALLAALLGVLLALLVIARHVRALRKDTLRATIAIHKELGHISAALKTLILEHHAPADLKTSRAAPAPPVSETPEQWLERMRRNQG